MSNKQTTLFEGDLYVTTSVEPSVYGIGSVNIEGNLVVNGSTTITGTISASHSTLTGLAIDDHTQYALLIGRTGGQILTGGTASGNILTLRSTSNATKGSVFLDETTASTTNNTGALTSAGGIGITNTTDAVSSTNGGTLTTAGGVAIAKRLYVGTDLSVGGAITSGTWNGTTISVLNGGTGQAFLNPNAVLLGNNVSGIQSPTTITYSSSTLTLPRIISNDTTTTTSNTTGSLTVAGGIGISNTTDAISATNGGTITTAGGVAIAKKLYVGTDLAVGGILTVTGSTNISHSALTNLSSDDHSQYLLLTGRSGGQVLTGGTASGNVLTLRSTSNATKGSVLLDETTTTTSNSTGSFRTAGGIGISNTTDAISATNGGTITTAGGVAIAKKLFVGTDLSVGGNITSGVWNGTTIAVANGGTGVTTSTGTGSVVLSTSPTLVTPVLGIATGTSVSVTGNMNSLTHTFTGATSGVITIQTQAVAGTYNYNLPITAGTAGQVLTSQAGGSNAMTWTTPTTGTVTSVALAVPSFLNVSGSPITSSGTITVGLSGTALPVANGGTGTTTSTGTGNVVLSSSPTLVTPILGAATGTSLSVTGNINSLTQTITGSTNGVITIQAQAVAGTYNYNLPITAGTAGQVLTSQAGGSTAMTWTTPITSIALAVPSFLNVSGSPLTANGTITVGLSGTALPVVNGGTGTTTSTGTGNVVLSSSPTLITPVLGAATGTSLSVTGNVNSLTQTITGSTSGVITIQAQAVAGTYNYNLPISAGTAGQVLTSQAGGGTAMTWTTPITSIALAVPSFLNVSGSPITSSGTITVGLSGIALPVANGGTGTTTSTGTGNVVLSSSPTLVTPVLGVASGTSINLTGTTASTSNTTGVITSSGGIGISNATDATSSTNGGSLSTAGGVAIAKKLFVGDTVSFANTLNMNSTRITNLANPIASTDAANKNYVDLAVQGLDTKQSVALATTTSGVLVSSFQNGQTIDGITLVTGDRILVKDQTNQVENGIYTVNSSGAPTRASDFNTGASVAGSFCFVERGTTNAESGWVCVSDIGSDVVGTNNVTFTQFSGAGSIIAGTGLTKSGNTLSVNASQTQITALGTITSGVWNATTIAVVNGGTGTTTSTGTGNVVLSSSPTLVTPVLGAATGTSLSVTGNVNSLTQSITGSTSGVITIQTQAIAGTYNYNLPITAGTAGQVLTSQAGGSNAMTWTTPTTGTVTSVALAVPSFLNVSGSPLIANGTITVGLSGTALPVANGGTGTTTSTGTGSVVLSTTPTLVTPVLGVATGTSLSVTGNMNSLTHTFTGATSGVITIQTQSVAGTYNYNLPITAGTAGQVLTSQAGGSNAMTWTTPITSIALAVPSFLNVSGSPLTANGTITVGLSGTALPVANGGTGTTSSTGTGNVVLSSSPTLVTPVLGIATGTSLSVTGNMNSLTHTITGSTSGVITIQAQAVAGTYNYNLPITAGTSGQVLTSGGGGSTAMTWSNLSTGTVTSVDLSVPSFLSISGSPITTSGTLTVGLSGTALPVVNGGTGTTTSTGSGNVVLSTSPTLVTPVLGVASCTSIDITGTTASTTNLTGSITSDGGIGISNTTDAISVTNGGTITTAGGVAIAKKLFVGTDLSVGGSLTVTGGINLSHSSLLNLTVGDDHTQYAFLAGRSGGQIYTAGTASGNSLTLRSTTNATKGSVILDETTATTSSISGALRLAGGLGISNTTDAVSSTNGGSITTAGGVGIAKSLHVGTTITTGTTTITNSTQNILNINCQGSTTNIGRIIFTNTAGTGDFSISGDGGDIVWQGGGGRACQMAAFHEIRLTGGRVTTAIPAFIGGSNATFNTIVQNTSDSIGLRVQANGTQTVALQQWTSGVGTVYSSVDNVGLFSVAGLSVNSFYQLINVASPSNPGGATHRLYMDTADSLFKSKNSTGTVTTYQPCNTKGDIATHNGTTNVRVPVGSDGAVIVANASLANGLGWVVRNHCYIREEQVAGTNGGTATSGSWFIRTLNQATYYPAAQTDVSLSGNEITLDPGTYYIRAFVPGNRCAGHTSRIFDVTNAVVLITGSSAFTTASTAYVTNSHIDGIITVASTLNIRVEQRVITTRATDGRGVAVGQQTETYTQVYISLIT